MTDVNKALGAKPAQTQVATVASSAPLAIIDAGQPTGLRTTIGMLVMHAWLSRKEETPHSLAKKVVAYTDAFLAAMEVAR